MKMTKTNVRKERGYTLLEYCAGAAIIAGVLWGSLTLLGNDINGLLGRIGEWARARTAEVADIPSGDQS